MEKKKSWLKSVFAYAGGEKKKMALSVVLSIISVAAGLVPLVPLVPLVLLVLLAGLLVLLERQVPLQQVQRRQP